MLTVYLRWGSAVSASAVISQGILRSLVALVIAIPVTESVPPAVVTAVEIMHSIMCVNADASRFLSSVPSIRSWVLEEGFRAVGTSIFILWPCLFVAATSLPLTLSTALAPQETEVVRVLPAHVLSLTQHLIERDTSQLVVGINRLKAVVEPFVSSFVALEALAPSHDAGGLATLKPALDTVQLCCSTLLQALQGIVYAMDQLCTRPQVVSALYSVLTPALAIVRRTFPIVPAPIHFPELAHTVKYSTGMCETTTPLAMGSVGDETAATASVEMGTSLEAADGPVSDSAESRRRDEAEMKARHVAKCCLDDFNSLRAQLKIIGQVCSPDSARKAD